MKLLIILCTFIFALACNQELDQVKVKSLSNSKYSYNKFTDPTSVEELLNGTFQFVADINQDRPSFIEPNPIFRIEVVDGFIYFDDPSSNIGTEVYFYQYSTKNSLFLADLCPGSCGTTPLSYAWVGESLYILVNNSEVGTEIAEVNFEPFNVTVHESISGASSVITDNASVVPQNYSLYSSNNTLITQANINGTDYDIDFFDLDNKEFIDLDGISGNGYSDLIDVFGATFSISKLAFVNDKIIYRRSGGQPFVYNETNNTFTTLGSFTILSDTGGPGYPIDVTGNINAIKAYSFNGIEYAALHGVNTNGAERHFLFNLSNNSYIAFDTQTNPATHETYFGLDFVADKLFILAEDTSDTLGGGGNEKKLFFYNLSNYPTTPQVSLITPNFFDYKFDTADSTEYDIKGGIKVDDYLYCMEDFEYAGIHTTLYCLDLSSGKRYEFHPGRFDTEGSLSEFTVVGDLGNKDFSPDAYFNKARVLGNSLYIPLKNSANFDYYYFKIYRDGSEIKYQRLADVLPLQQNNFAATDIDYLGGTLDGNFLSLTLFGGTSYVTINTVENKLYDFLGANYIAGTDRINDSGIPVVKYVDQDIIFGSYTRNTPSANSKGYAFIIDRASKKLILDAKLRLQEDLQFKRIGNDFYFSAQNHIDDPVGYQTIVRYDITSQFFGYKVGSYDQFKAFVVYNDKLIFSAKDSASGNFNVKTYGLGSDSTICPYTSTTVFQIPVVLNNKLYCRSSAAQVVEYDAAMSMNMLYSSGSQHPIFSFFDGTNIFQSTYQVFSEKLLFSGTNGGQTYYIYDPNTNTTSELLYDLNSNQVNAQVYKPFVSKDNELVFHKNTYDNDTNSVDDLSPQFFNFNNTLNQATNKIETNDTVNTDNGYLLYTSRFDELFIAAPGSDILIHNDITLGGNCSSSLRGKPSFQYANAKNKYALLYHREYAGGTILNNSLCFYKDGVGLNLGVYGFAAKDLKIKTVFENDDYYIFQVVKPIDNEGKIVKINLNTLSVSFISTFPGTEFFNVLQVGKGLLFCGEGVGVYDPYSADPFVVSTQYACSPESLYIDEKERIAYFALTDFQKQIGYELWSYCFAPNGNCSTESLINGDVFITKLSTRFVNNSVGNTITLTGRGFNFVENVKIGGSFCQSISIISDTQMTCDIPTLSDGTYHLDLITSSETIRYENTITYNPDATLTGLNPTTLSLGDEVRVEGTNFTPGARAFFDNVECTGHIDRDNVSFMCQVPIAITGTHNIKVINGDGFEVNQNFSLTTTSPIISSVVLVSDNSLNAFGPISGGTSIEINGANFDASLSIVELNGEACTSIVVGGANARVICDTPASISGLGAVDVYVENPDGQNFTFTSGFEYVPAPTVSSVNLNRGPIGGGTTLNISGTGFKENADITINGNTCTYSSISGSTTLTCVTTSNAIAGGPYDIIVTNKDNQSATLASAFEYAAAPTITAISPNYIDESNGGVITVTGTGFNASDGVLFYDSNFAFTCDSYANLTATSFDCVYAANNYWGFDLSGYDVYLQNNVDAQNFTYSGANLVYVEDPSFTSITPNSVTEATSPSVTISGNYFQEVAGSAVVKVGGSDCTSVVVAGDNQSMTCNLPALSAGTYSLELTMATGNTITIPNAVTYNAVVSAPTFSSLSTSGDNDGGYEVGGQSLTINGTDFVGGATVTIGGNPCPATVLSSTQIVCTTPAGSGTVDVIITNPDAQTVTATNAFTYYPAPLISSIAPSNGPISGGTAVTITGTGFRNSSNGGFLGVSIGGTNCTSITIASSTTINCVTPANSAGAKDVIVTNGDGQIVTQVNAFTYDAAPTITSIDRTDTSSFGGETINITGTGFVSPATVSINGTNCATTTFNSSTSLTCTTAAQSATTGVDLVVTNPDGQTATSSGVMNIYDNPSIGTITPAIGPTTGGTSVTITGTNFYSGMSVLIGGASCNSLSLISTTQLTCTTSASSAGSKTLTVINNAARSAALINGFEYLSNPTFSSVSPATVETSSNTLITINGTNFHTGVNVTVGGSTCTAPSLIGSTQITCTTPALASGAYDIVITNSTGQSVTATSAITFEDAPVVTSTKASYTHTSQTDQGHDEGGYNISIYGSNFINGAGASIGGTTCTTTTFVSSTELNCAFPSGSYTAGAGYVVNVFNPSGLNDIQNIWSFYPRANKSSHSPERAISNPSLSGETITINGSNFRNDGFGFSVSINGEACTNLSFTTSSITCDIPALAGGQTPGEKDIVINNGDGDVITLTNAFRYTDYTLFNPGRAEYTVVTSIVDNNKLYYNGSYIAQTFDKGDVIYVPNTDEGDVLEAIHPISANGRLNEGFTNPAEISTVTWVSPKWAGGSGGAHFYVTKQTNSNEKLRIVPLQDTTSVSVINPVNSGSPFATSPGLNKLASYEFTISGAAASSGDVLTVTSTKPILLYHVTTQFGNQITRVYPVFPKATDLIGVNSSDAAVFSNETGVTNVNMSNSLSSAYAGDNPAGFTPTTPKVLEFNGPGYYGFSGPMQRLSLDKPSAAMTVNDGSGSDATVFVPVSNMAQRFAIPADAKWVVIGSASGAPSSVSITYPSGSTVDVSFTECGSGFAGIVCKLKIDDDGAGPLELPQGTVFESNTPIQIWYEPLNSTFNGANYTSPGDETILHGWDFE